MRIKIMMISVFSAVLLSSAVLTAPAFAGDPGKSFLDALFPKSDKETQITKEEFRHIKKTMSTFLDALSALLKVTRNHPSNDREKAEADKADALVTGVRQCIDRSRDVRSIKACFEGDTKDYLEQRLTGRQLR